MEGQVATGEPAPPAEQRLKRLALTLTVVGGYVDAAGFLALFGLFVGHMSGNSVVFGIRLGGEQWSDAVTRGLAVVVYVLGVCGGVLLITVLRRRAVTGVTAIMLAIEIALLLALMLAGSALLEEGLHRGSLAFYLLTVIAVLSMAVQSATLRRIGTEGVHTTFITGMLTSLAESGARLLLALPQRGHSPQAASDARAAAQEIRLFGGLWLVYVGGAVLGALAYRVWELWCLWAPLALLALLAAVAWRRRG